MESLDKISKIFDGIGKINLETFKPVYPQFDYSQIKPPEIQPVDWNETIFGDIKRQIEEQNNLASQQIDILIQQNELLSDNYDKLKEMYDEQAIAYRDSNEELHRSRKYNRWMMVISIVAMLAAIAGPIVTVIVSK